MRYITKEIYERACFDMDFCEEWDKICIKTNQSYLDIKHKFSKRFVKYYEVQQFHDYYLQEIRIAYNKNKKIDIYITLNDFGKCRTLKYKSVSEYHLDLNGKNGSNDDFKFCFYHYQIGEFYMENGLICHNFYFCDVPDEIRIKCKKVVLL